MKLTDLRGILQYVPQFREKTFILALDAGIVPDENFATLLLDVALLRSLNIRVVLVHGAAEGIRALAGVSQAEASHFEHPWCDRRTDRLQAALPRRRRVSAHSVPNLLVRERVVETSLEVW